MRDAEDQLPAGVCRHPRLAIVLLAAFSFYASLRPARHISHWVASCWLADYRLGFVKRGLPGQLLGEGPFDLGQLEVVGRTILAALVAIAVVAAARVVLRCVRECPERANGVYGWWLLFAAAPFACQQLGIEFGRFDQITLLLIAGALLAIRLAGPLRWLAVPLVAVCPLVHEASLLLQLPMLFAAWWLRRAPGDRAPLAVALASTLAVGFCAGRASVHGEALRGLADHMQARAVGFEVYAGLVDLYDHSTVECVRATLERWSWRVVRHLAIVFAICSPLLVLTVRCWRAVGGRRHFLAAGACLLAGAPMFVLGVDFFRWLGNLWLCQWLLIASVATHDRSWPRLGAVIQGAPWWSGAALLASLYVGPIGVTFALDDRWILVR